MSRAAARFAASLMLALACASSTPPISAGRSAVVGRLRLVPHDGVTAEADGYGDRRLRDARLVDYDRPGFAVVYVDEPAETASPAEGEPQGGGAVHLRIRPGRVSPGFEPESAAVRVGHAIEVENLSGEQHVLSVPDEGVVRSLAPGDVARVPITRAGAHRLYLLDASDVGGVVYAAEGRFAVARPGGDFVLSDLVPGRRRLHVWHPRFPPVSTEVVLRPDEVSQVELELGVGRDATPSGQGLDVPAAAPGAVVE